MSYRYITAPDRALASTLASLQSSLRQVEKRVRWTGAHQMVEELGETTLPNVGVVEVGSDYTEVISLTVRPGRWVLIGQTVLSLTQVRNMGITALYYPRAQIRRGVDTFPFYENVARASTMVRFDWITAGAYASRTLPLSTATLEIEETTTFTLLAVIGQTDDATSPPWPCTAKVKMSRLQAVPL